jgi:RNase P/RNase MRP subunit p29
MASRSIKVKIVKETSNTVTIKLVSLNRTMPVPKEDFEKRVEQGLYDVVNMPAVSDDD